MSDSYIELQQLVPEDEQDKITNFDKDLEKIHNYKEKYRKKIKTTSELAEKSYAEWQKSISLTPWAKTFIWVIVITLLSVVYFLRKKEMYCFKKKITEEDDDHY